MSLLRIGDQAPDFKLRGIVGGQIGEYSLSRYKGQWLVLFFYPADWKPGEATGDLGLKY